MVKKYTLIAVLAIVGLGNSLSGMEQQKTGWLNRVKTWWNKPNVDRVESLRNEQRIKSAEEGLRRIDEYLKLYPDNGIAQKGKWFIEEGLSKYDTKKRIHNQKQYFGNIFDRSEGTFPVQKTLPSVAESAPRNFQYYSGTEQEEPGMWSRLSSKPKNYTHKQWLETGPGASIEDLKNRIKVERSKWWWQRDPVKLRALEHNLRMSAKVGNLRDAGGQWSFIHAKSGERLTHDPEFSAMRDENMRNIQPSIDRKLQKQSRIKALEEQQKKYRKLPTYAGNPYE